MMCSAEARAGVLADKYRLLPFGSVVTGSPIESGIPTMLSIMHGFSSLLASLLIPHYCEIRASFSDY